jgi:hypothetical protein
LLGLGHDQDLGEGLAFGGAIPPAAFGVAFGTVAFETEGLGPFTGLGAIGLGEGAGFGVSAGFGAVVAGFGARVAGFGAVVKVVRGFGGAVGPTFGTAVRPNFGTAVGPTFAVPVGAAPWTLTSAILYSSALYGVVVFHSGEQPVLPEYFRPSAIEN